MTRSMNRQISKIQGRKALKLVSHIERLGAAFCLQTGLNPEEVVLNSEEKKDEKGRVTGHRYWYEKRDEAEAKEKEHSDVQMMFQMLYELDKAYTRMDGAVVKEIMGDVRLLMAKYEEATKNETVDVPKEPNPSEEAVRSTN